MKSIFSNFRRAVVYFSAASLALPIAFISIAKLLLILCGLIVLLHEWSRAEKETLFKSMLMPTAILAAIFGFALSLGWTTATAADALTAFAKHGKLIAIPLLVILIRTLREASMTLAIFSIGQVLLLSSTWLLALGIPLPWHISRETVSVAVFSSYLDQSIMSSVSAAIFWYFRDQISIRWMRLVAMSAIVLALAAVFFVFQGRTGHVVAIALISLAIMWELPRRFRLGIILMPIILMIALLLSSDKVRSRLVAVGTEAQAYSQQGDTTTSSGTRLHFWHRSLQAMEERPWLGYGVGSWSQQYNRIEKENSPHHKEIQGNPHQEYLLWGVELGIAGILLLCSVMLSIYHDSLKMGLHPRRALQSVLVALAIAGLFNSVLYDALIGDFFCFILGILMAYGLHFSEISSPAQQTSKS